MLSPQLRRKVFNLWTLFWSSGITNPLTAIEQITYLLFLKHLELLDARRVKQGKKSIYAVKWMGERRIQTVKDSDGKDVDRDITPKDYDQCRWTYLQQHADFNLMTNDVFPWLRNINKILRETGNGANYSLEDGEMLADAYYQLSSEKNAILTQAIEAIDKLFALDIHSDLMGEVFEELLREIQSSGKNGQFRTPRHIVRFMVELVNPKPADRIIDPAAGTSGYLFASIQHLLKQKMLEEAPEDLRLEWDGTPHRLSVLNTDELLHTENFTGYDNDRTMVRIGWMNMILHGIESPRIQRRDSLSKQMKDDEFGRYTVILANPPFTGTLDDSDLHQRFLQAGSKKAFTNKSELLFLKLFLDLLEPGGRAAVIVPEGVLFGSTTAHRELRRQLVCEHDLKAVISLPAGVFQPYTGVKTSILYFHKGPTAEKFNPGDAPRTEKVLFYEVLDDGFSLDAKRNERYQPGDLPDALYKIASQSTATDYVRPQIYQDRWRAVDAKTVEMFPQLVADRDKDYGIPELFPEYRQFIGSDGAPDLEAITTFIIAQQTLRMRKAYDTQLHLARVVSSSRVELEKRLSLVRGSLNTIARNTFDTEDEKHAMKAFEKTHDAVHAEAKASIDEILKEKALSNLKPTDLWPEATAIIQEFAKLDGYTIWLRGLNAEDLPPEKHPYRSENGDLQARSWFAPVRTLARNPEWQTTDGTLIGSHNSNGQPRPEYLTWLLTENKYKDDGTLPPDLLDPTCIEASDFNLSAGRYKPPTSETTQYEDPKEIIAQLQQREQAILTGLDQLRAMMDGLE